MSKCWYCNEEILTGNNSGHIGICNKCYNEMFKCGNDIIGKVKSKITDLEAELAESEKQRQHLKDWLDNEILTSIDHESYYATINEYEEEIKQLKQQLAEKEQRVAELECELNLAGITKNSLEVRAKIAEDHDAILWENLLKKCENHNQDKISFCVKQLEKVKEHNDNLVCDDEDYYNYITAFIDNQIKQLKENK